MPARSCLPGNCVSKLAVIDVGTNSIHMVLAELHPDGSYRIVDRYKETCRLGNGAFTSRGLTEASMTRGLDVLRTLVTLARNKGFERIEAVATSAVREARNGGAFIAAVADQTDLTIRVVSGVEEARLIFLGIQHGIALTEEPVLAVDVGGGSVELMVGTRHKLLYASSLKLGAIRLLERYLTKTPPPASALHQVEQEITGQLAAELDTCPIKRFATVIATSGMAANLAEIIQLRRTGHPLTQLNLATVSQKDLAAVEALLAKSSTRARLAIPGLDPKRVDTLLPASIVLRRLLELTQTETVTLCDKAIREGVIYDFIARQKDSIQAEQDVPDVRRRSVLALARRCQAPEVHSLHVTSLALQLFDQTTRLHQLGDRERAWLEYAAMLHDVGYLINAKQHHKHTYYVITHSELAGFAHDEIELIATIARYHRRALPEPKHDAYRKLAPKHQRVVRVLSAILRVADGLDRTHFSLVRRLDVRKSRPLTIVLRVSGDAELEAWAARERANLLAQVFRRPIAFQIVPDGKEPA